MQKKMKRRSVIFENEGELFLLRQHYIRIFFPGARREKRGGGGNGWRGDGRRIFSWT